jgi:hypothetical protein
MGDRTTESTRGIEYYAEQGVTAGSLALLHHPVLHSVRIRNHMAAEGMGEWNA